MRFVCIYEQASKHCAGVMEWERENEKSVGCQMGREEEQICRQFLHICTIVREEVDLIP